MKKMLVFLFMATGINAFSQQHKNNLEFTISYGAAYDSFYESGKYNTIDTSPPIFGSLLEFNVDYALPKNRFVGIGYSKQLHVKNLDATVFNEYSNTGFIFDNYRLSRQKSFYDLHFRKEFKNSLHLTFGLFYFQTYLNTFELYTPDQERLYYIIFNEKQRSDNFGLSLALDYYFTISSDIELGLRGKMYYTLDGIETITLSPILKVSF